MVKREGENLLWNYVCKMADNIKVIIAKKKIGWEGTNWISVLLYCEKWRFLFHAVLNFTSST